MILVTGSTGNVGTELVPLLHQQRAVRALVRTPSKARFPSGVEVVVGDMNDPVSLRAAMFNVRAVYLIAFETEHVRNVVDAARAAGVQRIVRQSTIEAGMTPPIGPGRWHREQEQIVEASGCSYTHLRPTMMMNNVIQWWGSSIRAQQTVHFPGGSGRLSPVAPRDIARLAAAVLVETTHSGKAYNVTGPELLSIPDMVAVLGEVLASSLSYVDVPEETAATHMRQSGLPEYVIEGLLATLRGIRMGAFASVSSCVESVTGTRPQAFQSWATENASAFRGGE